MKLATATPTPGDVTRAIIAWLKVHPKTRYVLVFAVICTICYFIMEGVAWADTESKVSARTLYLPLEGVTDTQGVPVWRYLELPTDPGNGPAYFMRSIRHFFASLLWALYSFCIALVVGLTEWIVSFEWLSWIAAPFELIATGLGDAIDGWMLIPLGVLISSVWIAFGYLRGRTGAATIELVMVALVFGLLASPLTNPLNWLAGSGSDTASQNGLIQRSAEFGAEAGGMTVNPDGDRENITLSGGIIDVTLRRPLQSIAFGSPLEGQCEEAWNTHAAEDSGLDTEEIRKEVIKCDDAVADANQTGSFFWVAMFLMALPIAIGVTFLLGVFIGFLLYEVGQAFIAVGATLLKAAVALFPGNARTSWLNSLFQVVVSGVLVGFYVFALSVYVWLIGALIERIPHNLITLGSFIAGVFILIAGITFWKMKKSGKNIRKSLAEKLGKTGLSKGGPAKQPSNFGSTVKSAASTGASMYQNARHHSRMFRTAKNGARVAAGTAAAVTTGGAGAAAAKAATTVATRTASKAGATAAVGALKPSTPKGVLPAGPETTNQAPSVPNTPPGPTHEGPAHASPEPSQQGDPEASPAKEESTPTPAHQGQVAQPVVAPIPSQQLHTTPTQQLHTTPTAITQPRETPSAPAAPQPAPQHQSVNHIPAGNYGSSWVHKNGQVHSPMTIRPDGSPVKNIPPEDKINKAFLEGDSWVTSDNVKHLNHASFQTPSPMRARNRGEAPRQGDSE